MIAYTRNQLKTLTNYVRSMYSNNQYIEHKYRLFAPKLGNMSLSDERLNKEFRIFIGAGEDAHYLVSVPLEYVPLYINRFGESSPLGKILKWRLQNGI